jgi:hypothetical protein
LDLLRSVRYRSETMRDALETIAAMEDDGWRTGTIADLMIREIEAELRDDPMGA